MLSATDFLGNGERERIFSNAPCEGNIPLLVIVFRGNQMVWDIYGPRLEMVLAKLWPIYVYYVDLIWAIAFHSKPIPSHCLELLSFYCLFLWDCYVFGKNPYINHRILYGIGMGVPHTIPIS